MKRRCVSAPMRAAWCWGASGESERMKCCLCHQPAKAPCESHSLSRISVSGPLRTTDSAAKWFGRQAGLPRRARPQRPRWLAACPRTTHLLWSHFPQLRNRHRGSTPPAGCLESHVRKRTQRALGAGLLASSREMSCCCCYGGYCYCCSLPNNRRNTRPRSRLPAVKHRLLAGSTHNGLGELN